MNHPNIPEVNAYLKKAEHALEVARKLEQDGYPQDAAGKTYYAMFYASQALLKSRDIHVIRHSAVEAAIGYHFVKAGIMKPEFHRMLINARRIREVVDYDIQEDIEPASNLTSEDGERYLHEIKKIINLMETSDTESNNND